MMSKREALCDKNGKKLGHKNSVITNHKNVYLHTICSPRCKVNSKTKDKLQKQHFRCKLNRKPNILNLSFALLKTNLAHFRA